MHLDKALLVTQLHELEMSLLFIFYLMLKSEQFSRVPYLFPLFLATRLKSAAPKSNPFTLFNQLLRYILSPSPKKLERKRTF